MKMEVKHQNQILKKKNPKKKMKMEVKLKNKILK